MCQKLMNNKFVRWFRLEFFNFMKWTTTKESHQLTMADKFPNEFPVFTWNDNIRTWLFLCCLLTMKSYAHCAYVDDTEWMKLKSKKCGELKWAWEKKNIPNGYFIASYNNIRYVFSVRWPWRGKVYLKNSNRKIANYSFDILSYPELILLFYLGNR